MAFNGGSRSLSLEWGVKIGRAQKKSGALPMTSRQCALNPAIQTL
jgi:hypothetical protein